MRNTVADARYITADASKSRLDLAFDAGVLETGLDAAETIEARNSAGENDGAPNGSAAFIHHETLGPAQSLHRTHGSGTAPR
jgi:hypothetical protein